MIKVIILVVTIIVTIRCEDIAASDLTGLYVSGHEVAGFSGTKLFIETGYKKDSLRFTEDFYSDVISSNAIEQDLIRGECKVINDVIAFARPFGSKQDGNIILGAMLVIYHPLKVGDHILLFREDSYKAWVKEKKVYDYGILVKVKNKLDGYNLKTEKFQQVSLAEILKIENWKDPFVNGANATKP